MSKPHALMRIKSKLENTPHLIEQTSFNGILDYINSRAQSDFETMPKLWYDEDEQPEREPYDPHARLYNSDTKTGVLYIEGPLTAKSSGWEAFCGGTSYEMLKSQMESFVAYGAKTVVMMQDSGGGEAHGMMDSANYVRKLADDNGIKILSYTDGMSASASYGWTVIADEIIMSGDSQVGSVGVLIQLMNNSKQMEKVGIERTFITAGKDKVPFAKDGSFTEEFINRLQSQVDTLYEAFTSHVATHLGISQDAVKATEANVFLSKDAVELGLAHKVMTVEEFYEYLADDAQSRLEVSPVSKTINPFKFMNKEDTTEMAKLEEMQLALEQAEVALSTNVQKVATLQTTINTLTESLESKSTSLEAALKSLAELESVQVKAKEDSRKAALSEQLPADQVEANFEALKGLDEASFSVVLASLTASKEARVKEMSELGSDGAELEADEVDPKDDPITKAAIERIRAARA